MTLLVDLRQVDATSVVNGVTEAKGVIAGVSVEDAVAADGAKVARVRIRLTQPAAHQVRAKRNLIYVDLDSAFPLGSPGTSARRWDRRHLQPGLPRCWRACGPMVNRRAPA